ncbi:MAG TPA: ribosome maturation factor RimM [Ignavibacteria bacterium]|nr:ribosome maturation factor RimM [Ignavibacteria bacterium]
MPEFNNFIAVGKIVKPIGIKGNLKVIYLTDFPDRFQNLEKVFLYNEDKKEFSQNNSDNDFSFSISWQKAFDRYLNIKFEGFDNINDSLPLVNLLVMIDEKDRVEIKEGEFYFYELVGMDVYDKNRLIGKVKSVVNYGSGDLFNVQTDEKEILIPFRSEFVLNIDAVNKRIDTDLIDGFLD